MIDVFFIIRPEISAIKNKEKQCEHPLKTMAKQRFAMEIRQRQNKEPPSMASHLLHYEQQHKPGCGKTSRHSFADLTFSIFTLTEHSQLTNLTS